MSVYEIRGISVNFPFPPYPVQTAYMEKVIDCLNNGANGLLESPTGTGKTLSLLCSSLGWLSSQKLQYESKMLQMRSQMMNDKNVDTDQLMDAFNQLKRSQGGNGPPKIIYTSRTHSQLSQAIQELKKSGYGHMKAAVIGSRDQLCIHTEVMKEQSNANKMAACKVKIQTKTCTFHLRLERGRKTPEFTETPILDIEDLVSLGQKHRVCPFFVSKDRIENADIVFMPYNYILDPKTRNSNNVDLTNTVIIMDEAHNVEKLCEESTSVQLKSSDVATAISDVTSAMKHLKDIEEVGAVPELSDSSKDFSLDELASLKEILLALEKAIDDIDINNSKDGKSFPGNYIFDIFAEGMIKKDNFQWIMRMIGSLIQFLTVLAEATAFGKKGYGLQCVNDVLQVIFANQEENYMNDIDRCYRVHVGLEEQTKTGNKDKSGWITSKMTSIVKAKVINFWCFSPNFAMRQLLDKNTRCIILTSGTLAPMKPLISEMGIPVKIQLENPHIISADQICVKILSQGPDREPLMSNYQNRSNPKYIHSLGRTILSFCPVIPDGLLVFFPSYPILDTCQKAWQESGIWSQIQRIKPIYVEPRNKTAFVTTMTEYYDKIKDPSTRGAIFMAVCRGKVSEGLDFINENGRAVIITGLPFPPLLDPRVILKKKYLEENRTRENEMLSGDEWYGLEASRAVNQAIGRVIRHRHDYGAILLCDARFGNPKQRDQLSKWLQVHLRKPEYSQQQNATEFRNVFSDVTRFFRNADKNLPKPNRRTHITIESESDAVTFKSAPLQQLTQITISPEKGNRSQNLLSNYNGSAFSRTKEPTENKNFLERLTSSSKTIDFNQMQTSQSFANSQESSSSQTTTTAAKKRKYKLIDNDEPKVEKKVVPEDKVTLIKLMKEELAKESYKTLITALSEYKNLGNINKLFTILSQVFDKPEQKYLIIGMGKFIKEAHKKDFDDLLKTNSM